MQNLSKNVKLLLFLFACVLGTVSILTTAIFASTAASPSPISTNSDLPDKIASDNRTFEFYATPQSDTCYEFFLLIDNTENPFTLSYDIIEGKPFINIYGKMCYILYNPGAEILFFPREYPHITFKLTT